MNLNLTYLKEYERLSDIISRNLIQYNWNLNVLSPSDLLTICKHKGIEYCEHPLGASATGYYELVDGLPRITINSELTSISKWFALACKVASHFTPEPCRARALGTIALMPTWMFQQYRCEDLGNLGYCCEFLRARQLVAIHFPDVQPTKYPFVAEPTHVDTLFVNWTK